MLADSSKTGNTALTRHGFLHEVAGLTTNNEISDEDKERFKKLETEVIVVEKKCLFNKKRR